MGERTNILLLGATGYVGGSVLNLLLKHPKADTFAITASVRSRAKAKLLEQFDVRTVIASLDEPDKIAALASVADVIFNIASSDHLPGTKAILKGMQKFSVATGRRSILIHTSGTGMLVEPADGEYATETIYSDMDVSQLKSIPDAALHKSIDLAIIAADQEGYARTYIITPGLIYGLASGTVFDAGIAKHTSVQIPSLIRAALDRKRSGMIGPGKAVWPNVHVDDVAALFIKLFDLVSVDPERTGHGWEGYYFAENGHSSWYDIAHAIGKALVELKVVDEAEPTLFTPDELVKYWGSAILGNYWGTTCQCRADRGRTLGWVPQYTPADMLGSIMTAEVKVQLEAARKNSGVIDFSYEKSLAKIVGAA